MTELKMDRATDRAMVAGSGFALVAGIVALDEQVRARVAGLFNGSTSSELGMAGAYLKRMMYTAAETAGYHTREDTTLVFFAIGALVLFVAMVRS